MGGSKTQSTSNKASLPDILQKPGQDYISQFQNVASQGIQRDPIYKTVTSRDPRTGAMVQTQKISGYKPADFTKAQAPVYTGQRFADMTGDQNTGMGMIRDAAQQGVGDVNTARGQFSDTASGAYMGYTPGTNGYMGATTSVGYNPMLGMDNPYLRQAIDNAEGDVSRNYTDAVMPQSDAVFARSGAFGGSAWQKAQEGNHRAMAGELGKISTNMRMADYGAQQGLYEDAINRDVQAQQTDLSRNAQLAESGINRSDAAYQQERARQMAAAQQLPTLANTAMQYGQGLYNSGAKQQDFQQRNLDALYQKWQDSINEPQKRLDILRNGIGAILGNGIGGNTTSTAPNPNYVSPWQSALSIGGAVGGAIVGGPMGASIGGTLGGAAGSTISKQ